MKTLIPIIIILITTFSNQTTASVKKHYLVNEFIEACTSNDLTLKDLCNMQLNGFKSGFDSALVSTSWQLEKNEVMNQKQFTDNLSFCYKNFNEDTHPSHRSKIIDYIQNIKNNNQVFYSKIKSAPFSVLYFKALIDIYPKENENCFK